MAAAKKRSMAEELKAKALKQSDKAVKAVSKRADKIMKTISTTAEETSEQTLRKATKLAVSLIDFQKTTFDNTFKVIAQVQESSEKLVHDLILSAGWLPPEGKEVVREWVKTLRHGRVEFQRTSDKSFDLITNYFERLHDSVGAGKKSKAKAPAKKKSAPKKKAAKKAAAPVM